jgi:chemotaxis protein histidine kinase CheA
MTKVATVQKRTVDRMQVRLEHLDTLLGLAGEVIITSANLQDLERRVNSAGTGTASLGTEGMHLIKASNEATRRISQDLHDLVMAIRLVEIGETFRLLRRPVRDLARNLGREVEFTLDGAETLIDKALAERLIDPLLHLLRNAVDHGIEPPITRKGVGKPLCGRIVVQAVDAEHHTEIRVEDDGAGIDAQAVLELSRQTFGDRAERMSLLDLVCTPGLSTSDNVTATSGRGVGLDLVRSVVDEFNGELDVGTKQGQGTVFTLRIPKLRAVNIVDALTLRAGPDLYALPIEQIVASLGLAADSIQTAFDRSRHFQYQGEVVPLHCLQAVLDQPDLPAEQDPLPVIVVRGRQGQAAFIVSEFLGPQKLVNIPLDANVPHHEAVAGTAVFTGGKLGLTLDVDTLVTSVSLHQSIVIPNPANAPVSGRSEAKQSGAKASVPHDQPDRNRPPASNGSSDGVKAQACDFDMDRMPAANQSIDAPEAEALRCELLSGLQALQDTLLSLESDPDCKDHLHAAFRRLHAAKGHLTVLEAEPQAALAHHLETVLDYLRAERLCLTAERMDMLLDGVSCLLQTAETLPNAPNETPARLLTDLQELTASDTVADEDGLILKNLVSQPFELVSTAQLQVLSALKRGEKTYETYLDFDPGRQPSFLAAYLLLRRIGKVGTVLATLPSVKDIEEGRCGREVKVLWSTSLDEAEVDEVYDRLARLYNLREHHTIETTIFRYETTG